VTQTAHIGATAARRIALAAQGFADPRPAGQPTARHIRRILDRVAILQIDSVNVLARSHYLPVFSRLGPYRRELLDEMAAHRPPGDERAHPHPTRRELFEYWGHEASLLPVAMHRLLRWRMERVDKEAWRSMRTLARENPDLIGRVLEQVREQGPVRSADTGFERSETAMWGWHDGKIALEYLFFTGQLTAAGRRNFERVYDLVERVLPPEVLSEPTPTEAEAQRELLRIAARSLGVATEPDLGDYFRLPRAASKAGVQALVESGELIPVQVEGWGAPAYLSPSARRPRTVKARALLSPFDSLIWSRDRTERLFDFRYRLEIYTPAAKRVHGYYVLPFLLGESLVARVDLKADRKAGALLVQSAFAEPGVDVEEVAVGLLAELDLMAGWLGLDAVVVGKKGDLSGPLAAARP
jgi:uncharacterized protein YcaQ